MPFPYPLEHPLVSESLVFANGNEIVETRGAVQAWTDASNNRKADQRGAFNSTKYVVQVHNRGDNKKLNEWAGVITCRINWKNQPAETFEVYAIDFGPANTIPALSIIELELKLP